MTALEAYLIETLVDVIDQACGPSHGFDLDGGSEPDGTINSMALSAYARAIRLLEDLGRVKITGQYGRAVKAEWIPQEGSSEEVVKYDVGAQIRDLTTLLTIERAAHATAIEALGALHVLMDQAVDLLRGMRYWDQCSPDKALAIRKFLESL